MRKKLKALERAAYDFAVKTVQAYREDSKPVMLEEGFSLLPQEDQDRLNRKYGKEFMKKLNGGFVNGGRVKDMRSGGIVPGGPVRGRPATFWESLPGEKFYTRKQYNRIVKQVKRRKQLKRFIYFMTGGLCGA